MGIISISVDDIVRNYLIIILVNMGIVNDYNTDQFTFSLIFITALNNVN